MVKTRLDRWKTPIRIASGFVGDDEKQVEKLLKLQQSDKNEGEAGLSINNMIGACKELIYDVQDDKPIFHAIMYSINADQVEIELSHLFDIMVSSDAAKEDDGEDEIRNTLAIAAMQDIPVFPNTPELASELADLHLAMLTHGFTAPDEKGEPVRLKLTQKGGAKRLSADYLDKLDATTTYFPAEIELVRQNFREELRRREHAGQILAALVLAISDLEKLLVSEKRNEAKLQHCLTDNPILFGTDYVRVISKHRLGSEYEMDYALETTFGHFDLVEIESSNLKLFTAKGNPTSQLVHAEQQVFDWLGWIEKNSSYAREHLPGLMCPVGIVVIGRRTTLTSECAMKLKQRNALFRGQVQILTYDDLLDRAKSLLKYLEGA